MTLRTPEYLQTQRYSAMNDRYMWQSSALQEGVLTANDLVTTQRGTPNMSVDVSGGTAWVLGDAVTRQGLYHTVNDATINLPINASDGSFPRVDQVVLQINDTTDGGNVTDTPALTVLTGLPTSGASLTNRSGAAALTPTTLLLADILVPAASSSVVNANIRDRRLRARGAYVYSIITSGNFTRATAGIGEFTATQTRVECSGVAPVRLMVDCLISNAVGPTSNDLQFWIDGAAIAGSQTEPTILSNGSALAVHREFIYVPTPGSHVFSVAGGPTVSQTMTIYANSTFATVFSVEEILRY